MQKEEHAKGEKKRGQRQNIYQVDSLQVMIAVYSEIDNLCVVYNLISCTNPKKNEVGTEYKNISIFFLRVYYQKKTSYHSFFSSYFFAHHVTLFFATHHPRILNSLCEAIPPPTRKDDAKMQGLVEPTTTNNYPHPQSSSTRYSAMRERGLVPPVLVG